MSELPHGWDWAVLDDLAASTHRPITDGPFGSNLKTSHYTDDGPRVIRLQNIGDGYFVDEKAHISQEHYETLRNHAVEPGDLIVASLGTDLPRACVAPGDLGPAIVKADCIRIRLHREVDAKFVNYALQRPSLRKATQEEIHGVGRPRIGMKGVRALSVPVPPFPEQRRIVAAIEEHFSRLDAAEDGLRSSQARSEVFERLVDRSLLLGVGSRSATDGEASATELILCAERQRESGLAESGFRLAYTPSSPGQPPPDMPSDWAWATVGQVVERVTVGHVGPTEGRYRTSGIPFLRSMNVRRNRFDPSGLAYIGSDFSNELRKSALEGGDVVVVRSGAVGTACVVPGDWESANCADLVVVKRPLAVRPQWLARYVNALSQSHVVAGTVGVALQHFNTKSVAALPIAVPPMSVQDSILAEAEAADLARQRLGKDLDVALRRSAALRRSILAAAFSGQLVPQDPSDEPASVLLERIAAERAASKPSRTKKKAAS